MTTKKKVTIFTAQTGHMSLAQAIKEYLAPHFDVQIADVSSSLFTFYYPIYQYFPQFFKVPFKIGEFKQARKIFTAFLNRSYRLKIADILATSKPDIVISTYCLANPVIESYQKKINFPFINIVTDPRSFHVLIPSNSAINMVFDEHAKKRGVKYGFKPSCFQPSGWFVRQAYVPVLNKNLIRKKLSLDPNKLTILIAAGSEGTNFVLTILPTFIQSSKPVNVVFACGNNLKLYTVVKQLERVNQKIRKNQNVQLIPLKFTQNLHQYMQASDLVIGKAGPNLLFEAVATHTPFFAITHIAGQEDGNLDVIKQHGLGYVEENPIKANQLLHRIISQPEELSKFKPALQKLAAYNQKAPKILLKTINHLLG